MRPTWDDTWMDVAANIACRSLCVRAYVGAVIVSPTNRIIATGYNGPPAGFDHRDMMCNDWCPRVANGRLHELYEDCWSVHAETNAIAFCDRRDREAGTIYVTGAICVTCAKLIAASGLARCVYVDDGAAEHRAPAKGVAIMRECGLDVVRWTT